MTEPRKTRNIVGNVPEPNELYGREELVSHVWRQIEGNNILLLAPRRFGKTGVMRHILLNPRADYLPLYFDLEDVESPAEFVWRLTGEILK
jgi:AAA+ ATPase superfamily predicted ATPase